MPDEDLSRLVAGMIRVVEDSRQWVREHGQDAARVGPISLVGRRLFLAQLEDSRFVLLAESDDVVVMAP